MNRKTCRCSCLVAAMGLLWCASCLAASVRDTYYAHPVVLDAQGVIAPWNSRANGPLDERARIAVEVYKRYPWAHAPEAAMTAPDFVYNSHWKISDDGDIEVPPTNDWMCGDLAQRTWSIVKGLTDYYRYSGDPVAFVYIPRAVDYILECGLTPDDHPWPRFPIATPTNGKAYGRCDPTARNQLDLCARLGEDVLRAYKLTGDKRYFEAVKHWGDLFAAHCNFDPAFSPWNRYVDPSVVGWSDLLTGTTAMIAEFLDELIRAGYSGRDDAIVKARDAATAYLRDAMLPDWAVNDTWGRQYWDWDNPVMCGIVSMCGDYLLSRREWFPNWKIDVRNMLTLVMARNGADPNSMGDTYSGAWAFPESCACCGTSLSYNQYTAAPTLLRYAALAGDARIREIGRRMAIMATYDTDENGVVRDGLLGDTIAAKEWSNLAHPWPLCQVMEAMAWAPDLFGPRGENHVVQSTSVVSHIVYGKGRIAYATFDAPPGNVDVIRMAYRPAKVSAGGQALEEKPDLDGDGYRIAALDGDWLVTVRHDHARDVVLAGDDPQSCMPVSAWTREGAWEANGTLFVTREKGARAVLTFDGTTIRVTGRVDTDGGLADIMLDGRGQKTVVDCWNPSGRDNQTLYSRSGLAPGEHILDIVARGEGNPLSSGVAILIEDAFFSTSKEGFAATVPRPEPQRVIFGYLGRRDYVDASGAAWRPATEFVVRTGYGTDVVDKALWTKRRTMYIGGTPDPELFRYGIHGKEFQANFTVAPGTYRVRLLFAATPLHWFLEKDKNGGVARYIEDVFVNGERVIERMDVAEAAGGTFRALERTFDGIAPRNGILEIRCKGRDDREAILQSVELTPQLVRNRSAPTQ